MSAIGNVLIVLALVGANAFFVVGEYAVVTARRGPLAERAAAGSAGARAALRLMDDPVRVISTVQVGITALGILVGAIGEPLVRDLLGGDLPAWLAFAIGFAVVTYLSVVLGELVPKALTLDRAESLAARVARPIEAISIVLRPAVWVLQASAAAILRPFGVREVIAGETITSAAELRALVDQAEREGVIPRSQEEMLHAVFSFPTREAAQVMVPAPDVAWLDASLAAEEALQHALAATHSRYPVGRGTLDEVVGIVHMRDLAAAAVRAPATPVAELARPALFVPETKDLGALLREMREGRQQLAVVVDEYGDTAGVVPLEDILEQVMGEIEDEFDLPDAAITRLGGRRVEVAGSITIDDFNETLGTAVPEGEARTLAGAVFHHLGRLPEVGDEVVLGDVRVEVAARTGTRITRLRAEVLSEADPQEGAGG